MSSDKKESVLQHCKKNLTNIAALLIILLLLLLIFTQQKKFYRAQNALQLKIQQQTNVLHEGLKELVKNQFKTTHNLIDKEVVEIKKIVLQHEGLAELQKVQAKLDQIKKQTENLSDMSIKITDQLEDECQKGAIAQNAVRNAGNDLEESIHSGLKTAINYRIYAVNHYGVVLQDNKGHYSIAKIGKMLPTLGEISAITASKVFAGNYKIVPEPEGFALNQTQAIAAYQ